MIPEENLKQMYIDAVRLRNSINSTLATLGFNIGHVEHQSLSMQLKITNEFITMIEMVQEIEGRKPFTEQLLFQPEVIKEE